MMRRLLIALTVINIITTTTVLTAERKHRDPFPRQSECGILRTDQYYNLERNVQDNEFPWMVDIRASGFNYVCFGALIAKQYVLSSANCFWNNNTYSVTLGNCLRQGHCTLEINVQTIVKHPKFETNLLPNDISILRLKQPVAFSDYIRPICLPSANVSDMNFVAQHLPLTGQSFLGQLRAKFFVNIMGLAQCQSFYEGESVIDENYLCASTCDNGSKYYAGAALMGVSVKNGTADHYYLVGLLTAGRLNCTDITPDIFQRIDRHMTWIKESIANLEGTV